MGKDTLIDKRARLIDLASGGDGIVTPTIQELEPPYIDASGHAYRFRIVDPTSARNPEDRVLKYLDTREQAEKILAIGDLGI